RVRPRRAGDGVLVPVGMRLVAIRCRVVRVAAIRFRFVDVRHDWPPFRQKNAGLPDCDARHLATTADPVPGIELTQAICPMPRSVLISRTFLKSWSAHLICHSITACNPLPSSSAPAKA